MTNDFAKWFRQQLMRHEMSQAEFARRSGFATGQVSMWAKGDRHPSPASCKRIADVLFIELDEVLTIAGHRDPDLDIDPNAPGEQIAALARHVIWDEGRFEGVRAMLTAWIERDRERQEGQG